MEWKIRSFDELTNSELYTILNLRASVFVVEQECAYQDLDYKDQMSVHLFAADENNKIVAYCRILPKEVSYNQASIGRVIVKDSNRGSGIGRELVRRAINYIENSWGEHEIVISAQAYLLKFYGELGFNAISDEYLEDNIPHVKMLRRKECDKVTVI